MNQLVESLNGKKTFGLCAIGIGLVAAVHLGWIQLDPKVFQDLINAVTLASIAALRAAK